MPTREALLQQLNDTVTGLLEQFRGLTDPELPIYPEWTARDVLAHLTFWHESFARNTADLAQNRQPAPLKGRLQDLNQRGVAEMRPYPLAVILQRFESAHQCLCQHILQPQLGPIPYRKGSRDYSPEEHLEIVQKHIQHHLKDIRRALSARR